MKLLMAVIAALVTPSAVCAQTVAQADTRRNTLRVESGAAGLAYNTLQYPKNAKGTRFSERSLLGTGAQGFARLTYECTLDSAHGLRFVVAPLRDTGTGQFSTPVQYRGKTYAPGVPTKSVYQFNGYRATYWWRLRETARTKARVGFTLNIRDVHLELTQAIVSDHYSNVGPVPLAYLALDESLASRLTLSGELDAFAVPGGRAVDANVRLAYAARPHVDLLLGLRTLEGVGEEKNAIYNHLRYNYATAGVAYHF